MDKGKRMREEDDDEEELLPLWSLLPNDIFNNNTLHDFDDEEWMSLSRFQKKPPFISQSHISKRTVRSTKFGQIREWQLNATHVQQQPHQQRQQNGQIYDRSRPCTLHHIGGDVLRFILQLVITLSEDTVSVETCKAIAIVCKSWYNAINDIRLWTSLFEQKEHERIALIGPKYRMYPHTFLKFTLLQRWACLRNIIMADMLPVGFCGYATVMKSQSKRYNNTTTNNNNINNNKHINIREGRFINGKLRDGVEYDLDDEIKEGTFYPNGTIKAGNYEIWQPSEGQWRIFHGEFNLKLGCRDFGRSTWDDGTTYTGEFKHCDRHGIGFMKDASGTIMMAGQWKDDKLILTFLLHDGIAEEIQAIIEDHKGILKACSRTNARARRGSRKNVPRNAASFFHQE
jgi:hypothetical protein